MPQLPATMNNAHAAKEWASMDPNPLTRKYIEEATPEAIEGMFSKRIAFGTAGLRSKMLPGPANMNDLVIIQTAQGLAEYILSLSPPSNPTAVVGYDHRENPSLNLSSEGFAKLTKAVFDSYGISTTLLDGFVPTPLVPFAVKEQKASCGIMVTGGCCCCCGLFQGRLHLADADSPLHLPPS
jgi:phosphomannomutase